MLETGLSPATIGNLAPEELTAIAQAVQRRQWTHTEELLAGILETVHATYRATLGLGGVKGHDLPKQLRYPRPWENAEKTPPATRAEIAARIPRKG